MPSITKIIDAKPTKDSFHVLIIGAGTTGLLIAQGLKKYGISFSIYERTDENTYRNRRRNWSMALHHGREPLRELLDDSTFQDLPTVETDPWIQLTDEEEHGFLMIDAISGEVMLKRNELTTRRASREKLRQLLSRDVEVHYGKKLINLKSPPTGGVIAEFEDGSSASGSTLIGADGINSRVRHYLLGEKAETTSLPVIAYNFCCSYPKEISQYLRNTGHPLMKSGVDSRSNSMYMVPTMERTDPNSPETDVYQHFFIQWGDDLEHLPTSAERLEHFKSLAGQYAEPFKSAALAVPSDTYVPADKIRHWANICEWPNLGATATLCGDAIHGMSPFRGNGLNQALLSARNYVRAINRFLDGDSSLQQAIDEYDAEVLNRGAREIRTSAVQGYSSMHPDTHLLKSPAANWGFARIDYSKHRVDDLAEFDSKVNIPDSTAKVPELKAH